MKSVTTAQARAALSKLVEETGVSHEPIQITGKTASAVLISHDDWRAIQETMYLLSVPGMRESIQEGLQTPVDECAKELAW